MGKGQGGSEGEGEAGDEMFDGCSKKTESAENSSTVSTNNDASNAVGQKEVVSVGKVEIT